MFTSEFNSDTFLGENGIVLLPEKCDGLWNKNKTKHIECGHKLEIDDMLNTMNCTNKGCPCRIHNQIYKWARRNSIVELTYNEIFNFLDSWSCSSPYDVFCYSFEKFGNFSENTSEEASRVIEYKLHEEYSIEEIANIVIDTQNLETLKSVLWGYTTFTDFYEDLDEGGLLWFYERATDFDLDTEVKDLYEKIVIKQDDTKVKSICKLVAERNAEALYQTLKESGADVLKDAMVNRIESVDLAIVLLYEKFLTNKEELISVDGNVSIAKQSNICNKEV